MDEDGCLKKYVIPTVLTVSITSALPILFLSVTTIYRQISVDLAIQVLVAQSECCEQRKEEQEGIGI